MDATAKGLISQLATRANVTYLGDLRYEDYVDEVVGWNIGWIPHAVGVGEIDGDAIKLYEYWAAGLRILMTPIGGWMVSPDTNLVLAGASEHITALRSLQDSHKREGVTVLRALPAVHTWASKAETIKDQLRRLNENRSE